MSRKFSTVPIGETVSKVSTCDPRTELAGGLFEYIDISLVNREAKRIEGRNRIAAEDAPSRARQIVKARDILVSTVRPNLNAVAQVPEYLDGAIASTGFTILRPKESVIDARYLFQWVKSPQFVARMIEKATGASYPAVSDRIVKDSMIPLPPFDEQRCIAAVLDKADALREKRRQAITKLDTLLQAVFLDMFGDPKSNSHNYEVLTVEEAIKEKFILEVQDGNHGEIHPKVSDFVPEGIPFITANCLVDKTVDLNACYHLPVSFSKKLRVGFSKGNDVLLTHKGSVGMVAVVPAHIEQIILSPQVTYYRLNLEKINPNYLASYFRTRYFQGLLALGSKQSTRAYIGITRQRNLPVLIPPASKQLKFSQVIERIQKLSGIQGDSKYKIETLFYSLQQRAFNGELFNGKATAAALPQKTMTTPQPDLFD